MTKSTKNSCATVTPRGSEIGRRKGSPVARVATGQAEVCLTHGIVYPSGTLAEPLDASRPSCEGAAYPIGDQCLVKNTPGALRPSRLRPNLARREYTPGNHGTPAAIFAHHRPRRVRRNCMIR